ncbi:NCS2 family permease [Lederbergia wuyishanensis]|uniref:AGZA family xanthine/uracil permease-like MFS transporter n=1 Tax=Lederbergia wuyishanensis TaxID=1347903 RepID=A0ABU0D871_9BACI|nr:NCS2 family permease [Lederbergia wuyishanensis]MCJ8009267.1 NCS2 family permease [Lederbergia wuyishanensis]MDQ0344600.1 AGZA family xanthine/uracil permease-like MFS transporter [Lederbergia wuyishanensis]
MNRYFNFKELNTSYRQESVAGLTTFLAMAYILFVNPSILSATGMDQGAIFVATGLASALACLIMGLWAKYPVALAPGMGINAFFAFTVVLGMGIPWQTALAGTFISGLIFFILTLTKIRETIINAIPEQLKLAVASGIGLFIAFIGFQNAGIVKEAQPGTTIVALGDITAPTTLLAIFGLIVTAFFMIRRFRGAIFYGMIVTSVAGIIFGLIDLPSGVVAPIPSLEPTFGAMFSHIGEIFTPHMLVVIFTLLFVDFFDTAGTLLAVTRQAGLLVDGKLPRIGRALSADSIATMIGAILGTSTTTSYVESTSGVAAGGRTGFTSIVTAGFFILALFFSPLLSVVTPQVTAPALIVVGILMSSALAEIKWNEFEFAIPAFLTVVTMPLTYSISTGIALGFILYPLTMVFRGKYKEVHPIMYVLFVVFIAYLGWAVE